METLEIKGDKSAILVRKLVYHGKPVEDLSKEELLLALQESVATTVVKGDEALEAVKQMQAQHAQQIQRWVDAEKIWKRNRDALVKDRDGWRALFNDCRRVCW